jgi:hypothetical protein
MSRCHLKDLGTRFLKQVLIFEKCGFKNWKIEFQCVPLSVGHSVQCTSIIEFSAYNNIAIDFFYKKKSIQVS